MKLQVPYSVRMFRTFSYILICKYYKMDTKNSSMRNGDSHVYTITKLSLRRRVL